MITLFRSNQILSAGQIKATVLKYIAQLPQMIASIGDSPTILRYEFPCERVDLLSWLKAQTCTNKFYWNDRDRSMEVACVGEADLLTGDDTFNLADIWEHMSLRIDQENNRLRYYGGLVFDQNRDCPEAKPLGRYRFFIPRFEMLVEKGEPVFAFNIAVAQIDDDRIKSALNECAALSFAESTSDVHKGQELVYTKREDIPSFDQWRKIFAEVMDKLGQHAYDKLVLARKSIFTLKNAIDAIALLRQLRTETPACYHFYFQPEKGIAFLGASPERLYKRNDRQIQTEAIAGTKPRGLNPEDDFRLEDELLHSPKNAREHQYVVDSIKATLAKLCTESSSDNRPGLLKLSGGHHLITRLEGVLKDEIDDAKIIEQLHPTPAVAGYPVHVSLKEIKDLEPMNRGWYAAPIGYIGRQESEFAVAIRSGLVTQNQLSVYAGAGIVSGSTAEDEWNEIENKISHFISILDHDHRP